MLYRYLGTGVAGRANATHAASVEQDLSVVVSTYRRSTNIRDRMCQLNAMFAITAIERAYNSVYRQSHVALH
jgi:hypothetical protein